MGYTTEFEGVIKVDPPLSAAEVNYLNKFSDSRRMKRENGPYYVADDEADVLEYNTPPIGQPGLWCQWIPTDDGTGIEWDGGEKFYNAAEWMQYIIDHFFGDNPIAKQVDLDAGDFLQSHTFTGVIEAYGEERDDIWRIRIENNNQVLIDEGALNIDVVDVKKVERQVN
jgi:hypothetical protein